MTDISMLDTKIGTCIYTVAYSMYHLIIIYIGNNSCYLQVQEPIHLSRNKH